MLFCGIYFKRNVFACNAFVENRASRTWQYCLPLERGTGWLGNKVRRETLCYLICTFLD